MSHNWSDTTRFHTDSGRDIWAVDFTAHPLLDPDFHLKRSRLLQLTRLTLKRMRNDDDQYRRELARLFHSPDSSRAQDNTLAVMATRATGYLQEADVYLEATLGLLPDEGREKVSPLEEVVVCQDVRDLLELAFTGETARCRYEARRKLFLARTLLHIDQTRAIQDGHRHRTHFENLLNDGLWRHTKQIHDVNIGFQLGADGQNIQYTTRPGPGDTRWDFRSTFLEKSHDGRQIALDVLYYNCRFKRTVTPIGFEIVDGARRVVEAGRWEDMRKQSSGSILSKMIRNGINNPNEIGDLIGSMFIVHDEDALNDLLVLLDTCIGRPFGWRNVTDTLAKIPDGSALNQFSSKQFKVFKGDVDVLIEEPGGGTCYLFPVEIQIYTLESYLRTVCSTHEASHQALKFRQFIFGLVPRIFPAAIYGKDWLNLETPAR